MKVRNLRHAFMRQLVCLVLLTLGFGAARALSPGDIFYLQINDWVKDNNAAFQAEFGSTKVDMHWFKEDKNNGNVTNKYYWCVVPTGYSGSSVKIYRNDPNTGGNWNNITQSMGTNNTVWWNNGGNGAYTMSNSWSFTMKGLSSGDKSATTVSNNCVTYTVNNWAGGSFYFNYGLNFGASSSNYQLTSGTAAQVNSDSTNRFTLPASATGANVTISVNLVTWKVTATWTEVPQTISYDLRGDFNSWSGAYMNAEPVSGVVTYVVPNWNQSWAFKFRKKINDAESDWYGPNNNDVTISRNGNATATQGGSKNFKLEASSQGQTVTLTFNVNTGAVNASWYEVAHWWTGKSLSTDGFIYGDVTGGWADSNWKAAYKTGDAWTYVYQPTTDASSVYFRYKINDKMFSPAKDKGNETVNVNGFANYWAWGDNSTSKSFEIKNIKGGKTYLITFTAENVVCVCAEDQLDVLPRSVNNVNNVEAWAELKNTPAVYIVGLHQNVYHVSPEWEMTRNGSTYTLDDITVRPTREAGDGNIAVLYAAVYYGRNNAVDLVPCGVSAPQSATEGAMHIGRAFNATYNNSTRTLSLTASTKFNVGSESLPPYLGLIGKNFTQPENLQTPAYGRSSAQYTDNGWQESYIQYNSRGEIAKDINGRAMYSTRWPIANGLLFQAQTAGSTMLLSSDNLEFQLVPGATSTIQTGAQWYAELKNNHDYDALFDKSVAGNSAHANATQLDNSKRYARYVVYNVWLNGAAKIWTGWAGNSKAGNNAVAGWERNASWGVGNLKDDDKYTALGMNTAYLLSAHDASNGNFGYFADMAHTAAAAVKPIYLQSVEVFYCLDNITEQSVIYTTRPRGNASIQTQTASVPDMTGEFKGQYLISFDLEGAEGSTLDYRVVRYDATVNGDSKNPADWKAISVSGAQVAADSRAALVASGTGKPIDFFKNMEYTDDEASRIGLADGNYFYAVYITVNGDTENMIVAKSNPMRVRHDAMPTVVRAYQVILSKTSADHTDVYGYEHETGDVVAFNVQYNDNDPNKDLTFDFGDVLDIENDSEFFQSLSNVIWTPRFVVFNSERLNPTYQNLYQPNVTNFINMTVDSGVTSVEGENNNGVAIVNNITDERDPNSATLEPFTRRFQFEYEHSEGMGISKPQSITIQPIMPEAVVTAAEPEVVLGSVEESIQIEGYMFDNVQPLSLNMIVEGEHPNTSSRLYDATITLTEPLGDIQGRLRQRSYDPENPTAMEQHFQMTVNNVDPNGFLGADGNASWDAGLQSTVYATNNPTFYRADRPATTVIGQFTAPLITTYTLSYANNRLSPTSVEQVLYLHQLNITDGTNELNGTSLLNMIEDPIYEIVVNNPEGTEIYRGLLKASQLVKEVNIPLERRAIPNDRHYPCQFSADYEVVVCNVWPFAVNTDVTYNSGVSAPVAPAAAPARAPKASSYALLRTPEASMASAGVPTGIETVNCTIEAGYHIVGNTVVIYRAGVTVYNASGVVMASGAGSYNLPAGVYIINDGANGAAKVAIR